jgi:NTP pyrophosphatase (non-canonical NTP hydrolase)
MQLSEYQQAVKKYLLPSANNREYLVNGLAAEAGEVAGLVAKAVRDDDGLVDIVKLKKELGDVLWFVAILSAHYGIDLVDVATSNINKLQSRQDRNVLGGSGDER